MQAGGKQAWVRGVPKRVIQARAEAINHISSLPGLNSYGGGGYTSLMMAAIYYFNAAGGIVVAAAGNEN